MNTVPSRGPSPRPVEDRSRTPDVRQRTTGDSGVRAVMAKPLHPVDQKLHIVPRLQTSSREGGPNPTCTRASEEPAVASRVGGRKGAAGPQAKFGIGTRQMGCVPSCVTGGPVGRDDRARSRVVRRAQSEGCPPPRTWRRRQRLHPISISVSDSSKWWSTLLDRARKAGRPRGPGGAAAVGRARLTRARWTIVRRTAR